MKNFFIGVFVTLVVVVVLAAINPKPVVEYTLTGVVTASTDEGWHNINIFNETTHDVDLVQDRCIWIELDTVFPVGSRFYVVPESKYNQKFLSWKQSKE